MPETRILSLVERGGVPCMLHSRISFQRIINESRKSYNFATKKAHLCISACVRIIKFHQLDASMAILPFRLPLNIGTDIVRTARFIDPKNPNIYRALKLMKKYLNPAEQAHIVHRYPMVLQARAAPNTNLSANTYNSVSHVLAGRWAAKEAAKKAWGATLVAFSDLTVHHEEDGSGQLKVTINVGGKDEQDQWKILGQDARLSISHEGDYAVATVLAQELHPDILQRLKDRVQTRAGPLVRHVSLHKPERSSEPSEDEAFPELSGNSTFPKRVSRTRHRAPMNIPVGALDESEPSDDEIYGRLNDTEFTEIGPKKSHPIKLPTSFNDLTFD